MRVFMVLLALLALPCQGLEVAPKHWWVGMQNPDVQLLLHAPNTAQRQWQLRPYDGVKLTRQHHLDSDNYQFLSVHIGAQARPGTLQFVADDGTQFDYQLKARAHDSKQRQGFSSDDVIYLINPDRFANGNVHNDNHPSLVEKVERQARDGRRGGDLQGITERLDYLKRMGFTQLWLTPARENNMATGSYHGYAMTNLYAIDPRMGGNEAYFDMVAQAAERGIGVIMDMVPNHIGANHPWVADKPSRDWINNGGEFLANNHRRQTVMDPHSSEYDRTRFNDAWFVPAMPDLNQRVDELSTYLIQHSIWWIEQAGLSGIRVDTNSYSDKAFMARWSQAIMAEYPNFSIVGEEWTTNPGIIAYWQRGKHNQDGFSTGINSMMDFPLQAALVKALNEEPGWHTGWVRVYQSLGNDFMYANADDLLVFADNHDMSRIYTQLGQSLNKTKLAMTLMLTIRGIPQVYYGTEVLLDNTPSDAHGDIRIEFLGGFSGHQADAITGQGLSAEQTQMQGYLRTLLKLRKQHSALRQGRMVHFAPKDNVYLYARIDNEQRIVVILNKGGKQHLELAPYAEILQGAKQAKNLLSGEMLRLNQTLAIGAEQAMILALQ